MTLNVLVLCRW